MTTFDLVDVRIFDFPPLGGKKHDSLISSEKKEENVWW